MTLKFEAVFARKVGDVWRVVGRRKFNPVKNDVVEYRKKAYTINVKAPVFQQKNGTLMFLFDIEQGTQMSLSDVVGASTDPKLVQAMFTKETARQLVAGLQSAGNWMLALIIGVLGGLVGLFGGVVLQAATHLIGG